MTQWLVALDTDRIKDYLFATSRLNEIRTASDLLDRLNRQEISGVLQQTCPNFNKNDPTQYIYAAGGSALMILPDKETAQRTIQAVEKLYRQKTITASITGVAIPITEEDLQRHFGERVRWAGYQLRKRKAEKGRGRTLPVAPYMHFCDACANLPAIHYDVEQGQLICRACQIKRLPVSGTREGLWERVKRVSEERPQEPPPEWEKLLKTTLGDTSHEEYRHPQDFNAIGEAAKRQGYIALVYADGNRMGEVLERLETPQDYSRFAVLVDDLLRRITYAALMKQARNQSYKPLFEILMAGGDDLMIVTTPDVAFDLVITIAQDFEDYSQFLLQDGLSLGVGIAIAHDHHPIAAMQQLATDLQKRAKQRCFESGGGSAVDFAVITAAGSQDLDRIRDKVLTEKGFVFPLENGASYRLTQRPYTLDEIDALVSYVRKFKATGMPHSQLQAMYEAFFYSPMHASLAAIQTWGRLRDKPKEALGEFFQRFGVQTAQVPPPWRKLSDGSLDSALGDLVEIYPFL